MTLALIFLALTLAVTAGLVSPLLRHRTGGAGHEKRDIAVYREQLTEVENDMGRGLLTKAQAEAVRTEIHRRMLAVEDIALAAAPHRPVGLRTRKVIARLIVVLLPVMAFMLYIVLGSPELPGKPFASRIITWSEIGESIVIANDGAVVPEARGDFYKALKLDNKDARARFYLGLAEAQARHFKKAVAIWKGLQKDSPPDAPWYATVNDRITAAAKEGGFNPASIPAAKPETGRDGGR